MTIRSCMMDIQEDWDTSIGLSFMHLLMLFYSNDVCIVDLIQ